MNDMDICSDFSGIVRAYRDAKKVESDCRGKDVSLGIQGSEEVGRETTIRNLFVKEEGDNESGKRGSTLTVYRRQRRNISGSRNGLSTRLSTEDEASKKIEEGLNEKEVCLGKEIMHESPAEGIGKGDRVLSKKKNRIHFEAESKVKKDVQEDGGIAVNKCNAFSQAYLREYWSNKQMPDKLYIRDVETSSGMPYKTRDSSKLEMKKKKKKIKSIKNEHDDGKVVLSRSTQKQYVRMKIMDILLAAGWRIEYRPRGGKEYRDAVYISPDGRGFWSVTLAYKIHKEHHEASGDAGYTFTPVPEEELKILERITKKRTEREMGFNHTKERNMSVKGLKDGGDYAGIKKRKKRDVMIIEKKYNKAIRKSKSFGDKAKKSGIECDEPPKKRGRGRPRKIRDGSTGLPIIELQKRSSQKHKNRLVARSSNDGFNSEHQNYTHYPGKRCVLAWMIEMGSVPLNGKVKCMNEKSQVMFQGVIMADGICCDCCGQKFSMSKFATHVGSEASRASQSIYLDSGESLLQCQLDYWRKQDEPEGNGFSLINIDMDDPNDDTCNLCGDGGDLVCCDSCPSTFHQSCLGIQEFPSGAWHCIYCSCKFCGATCGEFNETNTNNDTRSTEQLICSLCEEKYHFICSPLSSCELDEPCNPSFCTKACKTIYENFQKLFGVKHELEDGFSWTIIQQSDISLDSCLTEMSQKVECNSKIAVAFSLMDECFLPIIDQRSGINLIRNIVYNRGSNFNRLNFTGFITITLERDDELVSAASIRIHGAELAEMPFIGTRQIFRRQGFCRRLLGVVEFALASLDIKKLVIPAVHELLDTWTNVFGFKPLDAATQKEMKRMNMLVFPCTDMLQKSVVNSFSEDEMPVSADVISDEDGNCLHVMDTEEPNYSAKEDAVLLTCEDNEASICIDSKLNSSDGLLSDKSSTDTPSLSCSMADGQCNEGEFPSNGIEVNSHVLGTYGVDELFECKGVNQGKIWCQSKDDNDLLNKSIFLFSGNPGCANIDSNDPDKNGRVGGDDLTSHNEEMDTYQTKVADVISPSYNPEVDTAPEIGRLPTVDLNILPGSIGSETTVDTMAENHVAEANGKEYKGRTVSGTMELSKFYDKGGVKVCWSKEAEDLPHRAAISGLNSPENDTDDVPGSVNEDSVSEYHEKETTPFVIESCLDTVRFCSEKENTLVCEYVSLPSSIVAHSEVVRSVGQTDEIGVDHERTRACPNHCSVGNVGPVCASTSELNGVSCDNDIVLKNVGERDYVGDRVRCTQPFVCEFDACGANQRSFPEKNNGQLSVNNGGVRNSVLTEVETIIQSEDQDGFSNDHEKDVSPLIVQICTLEGVSSGWGSRSEESSDRLCKYASGLNRPCCKEIVLQSVGGENCIDKGEEGCTVNLISSLSDRISANNLCSSEGKAYQFCGEIDLSCEEKNTDQIRSSFVNNGMFSGTSSGFDGGQPSDEDTTLHVKEHTRDSISEDEDVATRPKIIELCTSSDESDTELICCPVESDDDHIYRLNSSSSDTEVIKAVGENVFIHENINGNSVPMVIEVCTSEEMNTGLDCCAEDDNSNICGGTSRSSAEFCRTDTVYVGHKEDYFHEFDPISDKERNGCMLDGRGPLHVEVLGEEPDTSFASAEKVPMFVDKLAVSSNSTALSTPASSYLVDAVSPHSGCCPKYENAQELTMVVSQVPAGPDLSEQGGMLL